MLQYLGQELTRTIFLGCGPIGVTPDISVSASVDANVGTPHVTVSRTGTNEEPNIDFQFENIKGEQGIQGIQGVPGDAATVAVGTTTTGQPGTNAQVSNSGDSHNAVFNFTIPRGDQGVQGVQGVPGDAATVAVGTTTTGQPGTNASVVNSGDSFI